MFDSVVRYVAPARPPLSVFPAPSAGCCDRATSPRSPLALAAEQRSSPVHLLGNALGQMSTPIYGPQSGPASSGGALGRISSTTALATEIDPPFPGVPAEAFANRDLVHTVIHDPHNFDTDSCGPLRETAPQQRSGQISPSGCEARRFQTRALGHGTCVPRKNTRRGIRPWSFPAGFPPLLPGMISTPFRKRNPTSFASSSISALASALVILPFRDSTPTAHTTTIYARRRVEHGPDAELIIFKPDVKGAFKVLPMSVMWQHWQVYLIAGLFHVAHAATFGCSTSPPIWTTFAGFVLYTFIYIFNKQFLFYHVRITPSKFDSDS